MKKLILATALLMSFTAHGAKVKFKSSLCSTECTEQINTVCLGKLGNQDALRVELVDGTVNTYQIDLPPGVPKMGPQQVEFSGKMVSGKELISGTFFTTSGITVTYGIEFVTDDSGLSYRGSLYRVQR